jgi:rubrerythrin
LAASRFEKAGEATQEFLTKAKTYIPDNVASDDLVERLFSDKDGLELYKGEADALKNIDVSTLWRTLTSEEKDLFGSKQGL